MNVTDRGRSPGVRAAARGAHRASPDGAALRRDSPTGLAGVTVARGDRCVRVEPRQGGRCGIEALHRLGEAGTLLSVLALPLSLVTVAVVYVLMEIRMLSSKSSSV